MGPSSLARIQGHDDQGPDDTEHGEVRDNSLDTFFALTVRICIELHMQLFVG